MLVLEMLTTQSETTAAGRLRRTVSDFDALTQAAEDRDLNSASKVVTKSGNEDIRSSVLLDHLDSVSASVMPFHQVYDNSLILHACRPHCVLLREPLLSPPARFVGLLLTLRLHIGLYHFALFLHNVASCCGICLSLRLLVDTQGASGGIPNCKGDYVYSPRNSVAL